MDIIKYNTTLKAGGDVYKKIVFWNRFLRVPTELILSFLPAVLAIGAFIMGYRSTFLYIIYTVCIAYPIYIFGYQFKSSVSYHLKHRDPSEDAPCTITLTDNGIMADIPDFELINTYDWDDCTTVYFKYGYYMLFNGNKMTVMLNSMDMDEEQRKAVPGYIKSHVNQNKVKVTF